jgi:Short C-terminal domain
MMGLIRGVARTAAIAGTATAVSNRVSRRQTGRWAAQSEQQPSSSQPPPADETDMRIAQLRDLSDLKAQGVLSDREFQEQKARILGSY